MAYKVYEGFKQYSGPLDLASGFERNVAFASGSYDALIRPAPAGPEGKYAVVFGGGTGSFLGHAQLYHKVIPQIEADLCMSLDFRLGGAAYAATTVFLMGDTATSRVSTNGAATGTLSLEIVGRIPKLYHIIVTGWTGTQFQTNKLLLGEFSQLLAGQSYTLQMRGKIIDALNGEATVLLNGETMEVQFNPSRVTHMEGHQQIGFNAISTVSVRSTTNIASDTLVSDMIVYTHDGETPWPLGPIDLDFRITPDANLGVGPVNDATFVTITGETDFEIEDPAGDIIGAAVMTRANAIDGNVFVGLQVDVVNGDQVTRVVDRDIAPGFAPKIDFASIDPELFQAGTKLRLRRVAR